MTTTGDSPHAELGRSTSRLFVRALIRTMLGIGIAAAILFLAADTLGWVGGWLFVSVLFACRIVNYAILSLSNPSVLALRTDERVPAGHWDSRIFLLMGVLVFLVLVMAGLDRRLDWFDPLPAWSRLAGLAAVLAGDGLFIWAVSVNPYFSKFVKVQEERGHQVVSRGPYGWIRHPGYLGWLMMWLGLVTILGSIVALALAWLAIPMVAVRSVLEERTLSGELDGYAQYARRVPFRLIPGAW